MRFSVFLLLAYTYTSVNSQFQGNFGQQFQQFNPYNAFNQFSQYAQPNLVYTTSSPNIPNRFPVNPTNRPQNTINRPTNQSPQNMRISEKKCKEYTDKAKNSVLVGSLSFIPNIQGIQTDQCDASQGLIVGGENAKAGEFPHMAALGYRNLDGEINFQCGGSLISDRYVLTAAHCRSANRVKPSVVRLGDLNLKIKENLPEQNVQIERFISHEQYDATSSKNDIAVVRLQSAVFIGKFIRPACLSTASTFAPDKKAIATGWGLTEALSDKTSDVMQKVELNIISINKCNEYYDDELDNTQICAGELSGGKDTCQGDSGGPLQIVSDKNKCVYYIIGITSYGNIYCGSANAPGVYSRISAYIDWIEQKVWR